MIVIQQAPDASLKSATLAKRRLKGQTGSAPAKVGESLRDYCLGIKAQTLFGLTVLNPFNWILS
jgi:hypothetical protein